MDLLISILAKIAEYLVAPVGRQFGYVIHYKEKAHNLGHELEKLECRRKEVQTSVDAAADHGDGILPTVEQWLARVEELKKDQQTSFTEVEVTQRTYCVNGWCPNLISRYLLGRQAKKRTEAAIKLKEEGNFIGVSYPRPPSDITSTFIEASYSVKSRRSIMIRVIEALKDPDRFHMIGVCGMGGVGKTTMVKEIAKKVKERNLFDKVAMVVVSQNLDPFRVQQEIAEQLLGLKSLEGSNLLMRASELHERMLVTTNKRVLIILDDVWKRIELSDIGIPFGNDHNGCKIVLTSRNEDVCTDMVAHKFIVPVLNEEEAWKLFKMTAGISTGTTDGQVQRAVADECGGLPIAIVTVGRALKGKDLFSWNDALRQLQKSTGMNIREVNEKVFKSLELSYNYLEGDESKKCFLLCSLFPEDYNIPIEFLVRYGMGLDLFEGVDTLGEARDRVHALIDNIKKCNLLMESNELGCVKMHDVIRDVAITVASREENSYMIRCDETLKEWPRKDLHRKYVAISIRCTAMKELPGNLEYPELHLLQLEYNLTLPKTFDNFYQGMMDLKVLALSKLSIYSLPTSFQSLTNLRSFSLYQCNVENISIVGKLKHLEILTLTRSLIAELPKEIGKLQCLKLLDMRHCRVQRMYPGVLSSLAKLEELYLGDIYHWNVLELSSLFNLAVLEITLKEYKSWPTNLALPKVKRLYLCLGSDSGMYDLGAEYGFENLLRFFNVHARYLTEENNIKMLLKTTDRLHLEYIDGLENIVYGLDENGLENLKVLSLWNCKEFKYLIDTTEKDLPSVLPKLKSLRLVRLQNFRGICKGQLPKEALSALTELELIDLTSLRHLYHSHILPLNNLSHVKVRACDKLSTLFSVFVAEGLGQLESLDVVDCRILEAILTSREGKHEIAVDVEPIRLKFPKLKKLILKNLPSLIAFCKSMAVIELPQLRSLELVYVPRLMTLCCNLDVNHGTICSSLFNKVMLSSIEELSVNDMDKLIEIWPTELEAKLRRIYICRCDSLKIVFPANLIKCIKNLQVVEVQWCNSVEVVFELGDQYNLGGDVVFHSLTDLQLASLPSLRHVWENNPSGSGIQIQSFQNLTSFVVKWCTKLMCLISPSIAVLLMKLEELQITGCSLMETIVSKEDEGDDQMATTRVIFPRLISLQLEDLPKLTSLCPHTYKLGGSSLKSMQVIGCLDQIQALALEFQRSQDPFTTSP